MPGARLWLLAAALLGLPGASASGEPAHTITIANMQFGAMPARVRQGEAIVWVNRDMVAHTATARDGAFDVVVPAHQSRRMVAPHAGSFAVYCRYHPTMRAELKVAAG